MEGEGQQAKRSQEPPALRAMLFGLLGYQGQGKKPGHASPVPLLEPPDLHVSNLKASEGPGPHMPRPWQQTQPGGAEEEEAGNITCWRK